ncbi:syndecan [Aricia agestis]|uniref:syndecan n=1 Tax=Aricia agestis TaxID=91739 RepID=UPI001C20384B|nr:syndecan [Aricia agestis]
MQLSIYLWLTCVALAGYVRATEEGATAVPAPEAAVPQHDGPFSDKQPIDDEGSGLEPDESSGSGWGAGPGTDDEDARSGSGDADGLEDDEDYSSNRAFAGRPRLIVPEPASVAPESDPATTPPPVPDTESPVLPVDDKFDVVSSGEPKIYEPIEPRILVEENQRPDQTDISLSGEDLNPSVEQVDQEQAGSENRGQQRPADSVVFIMNAKPDDRATSFFAQPGILAAVIGGAVVGLLCAILVVMFIVYRMRKKDEGSYALDEPKRSPAAASYGKGHNNREFYA